MNFIKKNEDRDITSDTRAVLSSIYRYKNMNEKELTRLIKCSGKLTSEEVEKFKRVYKSTMNDLMTLFSDEEIKKYIGID